MSEGPLYCHQHSRLYAPKPTCFPARPINSLDPPPHSGRSAGLTCWSEYHSSGPCLETVWADTDNPFYEIEFYEREIGNLLPNNQRQRRTCYALCHILYPVAAALEMNSPPGPWSRC